MSDQRTGTPSTEREFPFTVWLPDEEVFACEKCGAWAPDPGEPEGHNRACEHRARMWADAAARAAVQDIPEGKRALAVDVRGGLVVVATVGPLADELREWFLDRAVESSYIEEVRKAVEDYRAEQKPSDGEDDKGASGVTERRFECSANRRGRRDADPWPAGITRTRPFSRRHGRARFASVCVGTSGRTRATTGGRTRGSGSWSGAGLVGTRPRRVHPPVGIQRRPRKLEPVRDARRMGRQRRTRLGVASPASGAGLPRLDPLAALRLAAVARTNRRPLRAMSLPSYPYDGGPRFVVRTVTGFPITESTINATSSYYGIRGGSNKQRSVWYVLDRANCHRIVGEYRNGLPVKGNPRGSASNAAERCAERCAELNAWNDEVHSAA